MIKHFVASILLISASISLADTAGYAGVPDKLIVDPKNYGQCMARFPTMVINLAGCRADYVSFACSGDMEGISKTAGTAAWGNVQLAYVTQTPVFVVVDNTKIYNEQYCVAVRTDANTSG
ncbi:hypothetical protein N9Y37_01925 [Luminiphilus sp.]|nr:hypothetical protein [Luminiphilus sp.]